MIYSEVFPLFEKHRWQLGKLPWHQFDAARLSDEQALAVKMNAIIEWAALQATEMFLRDSYGDSDFGAFMSVWFYEEQRHSLVLIEYLRRFRPDMAPTEAELDVVRFPTDPAAFYDTLMLHFCGEMRLTQWYRYIEKWHTEPLIKQIYRRLEGDEARHASAYYRYMERAVAKDGDVARYAFAKMGVLMLSPKHHQPLHPTTVHVSKAHYPNDTVQSRLPDPQWYERFLNEMVRFDDDGELRVRTATLKKLSALFGESVNSVRELSAYRKKLQRSLGAQQSARAMATPSAPVISLVPSTAAARVATPIGHPLTERRGSEVDLSFDAESRILWGRMHPTGTPCFTRRLLEEVLHCQNQVAASKGQILQDGKLHDIDFVVLASSVPGVFNLGGDLGYFLDCVRRRDSEALLAYAKTCVDVSYLNYRSYNIPAVTLSLVQGQALGGGFESAISSSFVIAEESAKFAFPEVAFNLFPGMGAYSYLGRRIGVREAEKFIMSGATVSARELFDRGVIDVLARDGEGEQAVHDFVNQWRGKTNALQAMMQARRRTNEVSYDELMDTVKIWVNAAMRLGERDLKMMERLARAQHRRIGQAQEQSAMPEQMNAA